MGALICYWPRSIDSEMGCISIRLTILHIDHQLFPPLPDPSAQLAILVKGTQRKQFDTAHVPQWEQEDSCLKVM